MSTFREREKKREERAMPLWIFLLILSPGWDLRLPETNKHRTMDSRWGERRREGCRRVAVAGTDVTTTQLCHCGLLPCVSVSFHVALWPADCPSLG